MRTSDITRLLPPKTAVPSPQRMATRGTVTIPPASITDDTATVVLPAYSADYGWPCRWVRQGNTLPAIGAECLVLWDEAGAGTVVQWAGAGVALPTLGDTAALDARLDALEAASLQARVYNDTTANNTLTTAVQSALVFNQERYDTGGLHSTSTNTSRLTAQTAGLHVVGASASFTANATGLRELALRINGTTFIAVQNTLSVGAGRPTFVSVGDTEYRFAAADYVEVVALQTSGGNLTVDAAGNYSPEFWMTRLGA